MIVMYRLELRIWTVGEPDLDPRLIKNGFICSFGLFPTNIIGMNYSAGYSYVYDNLVFD
jgi:hypothetical protein